MEIVYILGSIAIVSLVSLVGVFTLSTNEGRLKKMLFLLVSLSIGALLGDAFLHLIPESYEKINNPILISFLIMLGMISFFILERLLRWHHHHSESSAEDLKYHHGKKTDHLGKLILISDGLHNFIDGIVIGASYMVSVEIGIATTLAVILHEIPQEIGDFGVLIHSGYKVKEALFFNFLSAIFAFGGAMLILSIRSVPDYLLSYILPFTAGTFIYIAASDLVPELHESGEKEFKNILYELLGIGIGFGAMYALLFLE